MVVVRATYVESVHLDCFGADGTRNLQSHQIKVDVCQQCSYFLDTF